MNNNFKNGFIKYGLDHGYIKPPKKEKPKQLEFDFSEPKKTVEKMDGLEKIDHLINRQLLEDQL